MSFELGFKGAGNGESRSWAELKGGSAAVDGWDVYWKAHSKQSKSETVHDLKTVDRYFDAVVAGSKTFEVRLNDRAFQTGDVIRLRKINDKGYYVDYTTAFADFRITYILQGGQFGIEPRYCVLGLGPV
jgi:hypothetical protein